jgi:hypothetical protein
MTWGGWTWIHSQHQLQALLLLLILLLLNQIPNVNPIILEDIDISLEWVVESRSIEFEDDGLGWMDLDPQSTPTPSTVTTIDTSGGLR